MLMVVISMIVTTMIIIADEENYECNNYDSDHNRYHYNDNDTEDHHESVSNDMGR